MHLDDTLFTSESVCEGHPDKVCDFIADSILDAHLEADPHARVACEVVCKNDTVVLAGEISSRATVDADSVVRQAVATLGYQDDRRAFSAANLRIINLTSPQAPDIAAGVGQGLPSGAGDQGMVFGYADRETPELMPLPILLAHRLTRALAQHRRGPAPWLGPDGKAQVTVHYREGSPVELAAVVVSAQHEPGFPRDRLVEYLRENLLPPALGQWWSPQVRLHLNPAGEFSLGGPEADCGLTGRKIMVDTYGGFARHGGGAFSGKDPSKVDRSAAYFCRWVARSVVRRGLARRCELQVAYAIGVDRPVSVNVETFGTGDPARVLSYVQRFDFRPAAIIEQLGLDRPLYRSTTNYGHFGRPGLPWEA